MKSKPYCYGKDEILSTLEAMLQTALFEFENRTCVYQALQRTKQGRGDCSDYLIGAVALSQGCMEIVTFERKLRNVSASSEMKRDFVVFK